MFVDETFGSYAQSKHQCGLRHGFFCRDGERGAGSLHLSCRCHRVFQHAGLPAWRRGFAWPATRHECPFHRQFARFLTTSCPHECVRVKSQACCVNSHPQRVVPLPVMLDVRHASCFQVPLPSRCQLRSIDAAVFIPIQGWEVLPATSQGNFQCCEGERC